jgi:hypothetical protein
MTSSTIFGISFTTLAMESSSLYAGMITFIFGWFFKILLNLVVFAIDPELNSGNMKQSV